MGSQIVRTVKGRDYLYYAYYDENKRIEKYCGLAAKSESKKRAKNFEIADLQAQKDKISRRIADLRSGKGG